MIPDHTPCIWTITDEFNHLKWFRSLTNKISDKVEMILIYESDFLHKSHEFIITTMDITNEERSRHSKNNNSF